MMAPGPGGSRVNPEAHGGPFAPAGATGTELPGGSSMDTMCLPALPGLSCRYFVFHKAKGVRLSSS